VLVNIKQVLLVVKLNQAYLGRTDNGSFIPLLLLSQMTARISIGG